MKEKTALTATIKIKKLNFLYEAMISSVLANVIVTLILAFFLFNGGERAKLFIWAGSIIIVALFRITTSFIYTGKKNPDRNFYFLLFYIPMLLMALTWGLSGFLFYSGNNYINTIVIICVMGISMGSVTTLSSFSLTIYTFQTALLIPYILRLFTMNSRSGTTLGLLLSIYLIFIITISTKIKRMIGYNLEFREKHVNFIEELKFSENKFKTIFNNAPVGIFYVDNNLIIYDCNEEFCSILETTRDKLLYLDLHNLKDKRVFYVIAKSLEGTTEYYEGDYETSISGNRIWINLSVSPIYDKQDNVIGCVGITQNRTEMQLAEEKVRHLAFHDNLTSLPNRLLLKERIKQSIVHISRSRNFGAILFLDLDNFKTINDTMGHHIGDMILKETALRLKSVLRKEDTVSRIGGDEFVIVLQELHSTQETSSAAINLVSDKIHNILKEPFIHMEKKLFTSTSIGVTLFSWKDTSVENLLKDADIAMYEAKKRGKSCTNFFNKEMNERITKRVELENNLRIAIKDKQLRTYFQPIYQCSNDSEIMVGAETLLRWEHPELGIISPEEFIPLAEETNLIVPIGEWIIEEVCRSISRWRKKYTRLPNYISINVSVNQLRDDNFVSVLLKHTSSYGVKPSTILLEVTESLLISNFNFIADKINALRNSGFRFALDDFGTGYSSLTYLKKLELDVIKIDRSFVKDIYNNNNDIVLVEAIISIAKNFNMKIVTEGIEDMTQLTILKKLGCKYFQGYYFSKPLPDTDFKILLG